MAQRLLILGVAFFGRCWLLAISAVFLPARPVLASGWRDWEEVERRTPDTPVAAPARSAASSGPPLAQNAAYFELAGSAFGFSLNYERRPIDALALRAGVGIFPACAETCDSYLMFPLLITVLAGGSDHLLELGGGAVPGLNDEGEFGLAWLTATLGYRYQMRSGGVLLRVAFTPLIPTQKELGFFPWPGVAMGAAW